MPRMLNPVPQYLDDSGKPLPNGKLYFYESGTSTDKTTFADVNLTIANTQPVLLSAAGRVPNIFYNGVARQVLTDSDDVQIWDKDPVGDVDPNDNISQWSPVIIYSLGDIVQGSDLALYRSIQEANQNEDPTTESTFWEEIQFISVWNSSVTYNVSDISKGSDGFLYRSLTNNNVGNDPTVDMINWGGTQATDIADGSITLAKMAHLASQQFIGRNSAGTGPQEEVPASTARTILNVADGSTANSTDAFLLDRTNHTGTQLMATVSDAGALAVLDTITLAEVTDSGALAALNDITLALVTDSGALAALNDILLNVIREYTSSQSFDATTLSDAVNISWDASLNQVTSVTLAGNRTLDNPTNMRDGATYILIVKQDATGSRTLAYGTSYKFAGGDVPVLTTTANAVDILTFVSDGSSMFGAIREDFS